MPPIGRLDRVNLDEEVISVREDSQFIFSCVGRHWNAPLRLVIWSYKSAISCARDCSMYNLWYLMGVKATGAGLTLIECIIDLQSILIKRNTKFSVIRILK